MNAGIPASSGLTNVTRFLSFSTLNATTITLRVNMFPVQQFTIDWGDTVIETFNNGGNASHTYGSPFTGVVKVYPGNRSLNQITQLIFNDGGWRPTVKDFYRLPRLSVLTAPRTTGDIDELPKTITLLSMQGGSNPITGSLLGMPTAMIEVRVGTGNTLSGLLSSLPNSVTLILISGSNIISGGLHIPPLCTSFILQGNNTITGTINGNVPNNGINTLIIEGANTLDGDIATLPNINIVRITGQNKINQYTGKNWGTQINEFTLLPASGFGLTSTMVDNILIDMAATVVTAGGAKLINLSGNNAPRTAASNAAKSILESLGFTVTTN